MPLFNFLAFVLIVFLLPARGVIMQNRLPLRCEAHEGFFI